MSSAIAQSRFNFDAPAARRAAHTGMARVEGKANPEWIRVMVECGRVVATRQLELSCDDIVNEFAKLENQPVTSNMRAMSGVIKQLQRDGTICFTGEYVNSIRVNQHRCPIKRYESLIYRGPV